VTLRQLMGHVAGLSNDGGDEGPLFSVRCERPVEALRYFKDSPLLFEPGSKYRYSSYGWILVSAAVEAAADQPFQSFMRRQIFKPLRMDDTEADSATEPIANRATFYFPRFAADPRYGPDPMRPLDYSCYGVIQRVPVHAVRPGAFRHRDQQRRAAAARHRPIAPDATATRFRAGDGLRSRLGPGDGLDGG
jgi:CubicO group peptidase (beta-lactamase class C family)